MLPALSALRGSPQPPSQTRSSGSWGGFSVWGLGLYPLTSSLHSPGATYVGTCSLLCSSSSLTSLNTPPHTHTHMCPLLYLTKWLYFFGQPRLTAATAATPATHLLYRSKHLHMPSRHCKNPTTKIVQWVQTFPETRIGAPPLGGLGRALKGSAQSGWDAPCLAWPSLSSFLEAALCPPDQSSRTAQGWVHSLRSVAGFLYFSRLQGTNCCSYEPSRCTQCPWSLGILTLGSEGSHYQVCMWTALHGTSLVHVLTCC